MEKTELFYSIGLEKEKLFSDSKILEKVLDSEAHEKFKTHII